ncbi:Sua5/YciO/YrdC/YwlC family protein [Pseudoxanthomonas sacheonensis]|uniref:Threonylcarbamoyl-AMP synthase n=1 Tax=Pseudoxanthomonas sacheonensis TaxID=443615 RepID=A0ABU1RTG1_9GAMM|nr:Sua5/YciO/YrdC/YwlC family protein [Pseudoxanthomonas sacheonensis]MDR6842071.1 L-threonylcarbamoyladenylate synthase [Pseudoxanthomonas sacheonensis]
MTAPLLSIPEAATALQTGGVIAYPTEAVWGLGCDPRDEAAVLRLLAIKQRAVDKGLILIASQYEQLRPFLDITAVPVERLAEVLASWPGPHTWVMPAASAAPRWITGAHAGIAVRISAHPLVIELCNAYGGALVSTSANRAGQPAAMVRETLDSLVLEGVDGLVAGETGGLGAPTAIRDALTGVAIRQ